MKQPFLALLLALLVSAPPVPARAGAGRPPTRRSRPPHRGIEVLHVRGPIYALIGAGGNITVSVGTDGALLVDSGSADMSDAVLAAIRQLQRSSAAVAKRRCSSGPKPVRPSRCCAPRRRLPSRSASSSTPTCMRITREAIRRSPAPAGRSREAIVAGDIGDTDGAAVLAHEKVLFRMTAAKAPFAAVPTDTYFEAQYKLSHHFNGEGIQLIHQPAAHTDGDSLVWFRGSDVISTGDLFLTTGYPVIDLEEGGSINGLIDSLNRILDLAFPEFRTEGGTMIVPGHGRLSDSADVAYYRDMVTVIRDRVQDMIKKGMTLEQVKAAAPTKDYDPRYGADTGSWTTAMFVEAVYRSLRPGK